MQLESPPDSTPVLSSPTTPQLPHAGELDAYVRRTVIQGSLLLVALLVAIAYVGLRYDQQLLAVTAFVERNLGLWGLATLVFLADSFTLPVPPDLVLMVIANSSAAEGWRWLVPLLGFVSAIAGMFGFVLGAKLRTTRIAQHMVGRFQQRNAGLLLRYGWVAVALGALTPIPFSITCWIAGMLQLRWTAVAAACLLRVPRFAVYYLLISHSTRLLQGLW